MAYPSIRAACENTIVFVLYWCNNAAYHFEDRRCDVRIRQSSARSIRTSASSPFKVQSEPCMQLPSTSKKNYLLYFGGGVRGVEVSFLDQNKDLQTVLSYEII
jgi:hypothetical protein